MPTQLETKSAKYLLFSLASTGVVILFANYLGRDAASITSNWLNLPVTGAILALSIIMIAKNGIRGSHGKAWIFFTVSITFWFVAERIWTIYETIYKTNPWPSEADFFWLAGYPLYFIFSILYIKPFKGSISKKILSISIVIPVVILIPTLYVSVTANSELTPFEKALAASYPIADAVTLGPVIAGIILFFRGAVNFPWSMMLIGMLCFAVSDFGYLYLSLDDSYYTGHPIDIPYIWAYIFFSFGLYSNMSILRKRSKEDVYHDQESLR